MFTVYFKKQGLSKEWSELLLRNPFLVFLVLLFCQKAGKKITITEIFRTEEQQRAYYPDQPMLQSVHQDWRGVDISLKNIDIKLAQRIVDNLNVDFPYGKKGIVSFLIHDTGLGLHLHVQTLG